MSDPADWIAVDWGTSSFRLWPMRGGAAVGRVESDEGMNAIGRDDYPRLLLRHAGPWLGATRTPVVVCGMAGARQGWLEAPYAEGGDLLAGAVAPEAGPRLEVRILPGLAQREPPDVMRGEETQIAGLLAEEPGFEGVAVSPGTHSKWVWIEGGRVAHFRTMMTGELFGLLAERSTLRHALDPAWDDAAFAEGVTEALAAPEALLAELFSVRARSLLVPGGPGAGRARLSGLLIGAEIAAAGGGDLGRRAVRLIADGRLGERYAAALALAGIETARLDAERAVLAGLAAAHARLFGDAA